MLRPQTAFLFDLDGTLVDSVYQHVLAWREALDVEKLDLSVWRIHRKIGMSGGLFTNMLFRETGLRIEPERIDRLRQLHAAAYRRHFADETCGVFEHLQSLLQIDNIDSVTFAEDIFFHLRIPALGLVPEVNAGFEQFLH